MKTIQKAAATFSAAALLFLVAIPSSAQLYDGDSEFAHFDSAPDAEHVFISMGDAQVALSFVELRIRLVLSETDWAAYSSNLEDALGTGHTGLQNSALRLIIAYSDNLNMSSSAVVEVMKLYRDGETDQIRRMAVVALSEMDSDLAMDYLVRAYPFEQSESVKKTILAVVNQSRASV